MKKIKMYLGTIALTILTSKVQAGSDLCLERFPEGMCGPITKISCTYGSGIGSKQEVNFELAEAGDFRNIHGPSVNLKVNNAKDITTFTVQKQDSGSMTITHLYFRNNFFISDIHLSFSQDEKTKTLFNPVEGSWIVDYPPVIQLSCHFGGPNI